MWSLVLLIACGSAPPTVTSVDPSEGLPGASLKVFGEDFPAGASVALVLEDEVVPISDASVRGPVLIEGTIPEGLSAGVWTVRVEADGVVGELATALTVTVPQVELPCGGKFKANTQLSLAREVVVIDRFYDDGDRKTLRIPIPQIEQVEYELVKLDDETLCGTIYMKKKDGTRVAFDDDTRLNLQPRAYKLGNVMNKPTVTTRKDVEEDPRPVEQN